MTRQDALFGDPVDVPDSPPARKAATQDPDLIASVVRQAQEPGYRVVEKSGRVFRVDPGTTGAVEPVPTYEAETVLQLIDTRALELGGNHTIRVGGNSGPSRSVLVPKDTARRIGRWAHLRPLRPRTAGTRTGNSTGQGDAARPENTCGPITVRPSENGRSMVTCDQFTGSVARAPGAPAAGYRYRVRNNADQQIGHASSREAGARLLARYHGWAPGPVRTDR